jgi:flagellar protein FliS
MQKAAQAYFKTQVVTTNQGDLLLMLYDGAIKYLRQAQAKIDEKDYATKGILLGRAADIINELASSLNKEKGGEIADNLSRLYVWCSSRLMMANLRLDKSIVEDVIQVLSRLKEAYSEILTSNPEAKQMAAQPPGAAQTAAQPTPPRPQAGGQKPAAPKAPQQVGPGPGQAAKPQQADSRQADTRTDSGTDPGTGGQKQPEKSQPAQKTGQEKNLPPDYRRARAAAAYNSSK